MPYSRLSLNASAHIDALRYRGIIDASGGHDFDDLIALAAQLCKAPIAAISFVDQERQWFKSAIGVDAVAMPRNTAFCTYAVGRPEETMMVEDAWADDRFTDSPLVRSSPHVRFYAGAPLVTAGGHALGTLCVMDRRPRRLEDAEAEALRTVARLAGIRLGLHRRRDVLSTLLDAAIESTSEAIVVCDVRQQDCPIVFVNSAFERITGYSARDAVGRNPRFLQGPDSDPAATAAIREALSAGTDCIVEIRNYHKNGTPFWNELKMSPVRDKSGRPTHFIGVQTDITARKQREEQSVAAAERLHVALSLVDVAVFAQSPDLRYTWMYKPQLGYTPEGMIGKTDAERLSPEDASGVEAVKRRALADGRGAREVVALTWEGEARYLDLAVEPQRDASGTITGLVGASLDITRQVREESASRELAEQYHAMLATITEGFWLVDDHGRLLDVNEAYCRMSGYTRDELLRCTVSDLEAVEDQRETLQHIRAVMETGADRFNSKHRAKDGRVFDVEISASYNRARQCFFVFVQDISAQVKMERAMRLQAAALQAAADAIVITDANGVIEWVNPAFVESSGFAAVEALGKHPGDLIKSGNQDQAFYRDLWDTIRAGRVWHGEVVNRRKDGGFYTERQSITPVQYEPGVITHFIAIKEDITERMQLQQQLLQAQKMESIGRLAGGIAHDFNNLLSVILGWTGIALDELPAGHSVSPYLEEVLKAGQGAATLTRQLLAFSRQQVVEPTVFNVADLVVEMEKMLRRLLGEDIELMIRAGAEPNAVRMDRGQLEQVLMNLVVNARDAMPDGGKLTVETANAAPDGQPVPPHAGTPPVEYVTLAVSDTGLGMSEEVKARMFEPFFTTKETGKGTGLGLAMCYGIVKQAGGDIAVDSVEGFGTTIKVYLPRREESAELTARHVGVTRARGTETILLVEDDPAVRLVTARMLEAQGYRVLSTNGGEEALRLIEAGREPWDLLLTDVVLSGGMSGPKLAERVHALKPGLKVLFASGYTHDMSNLDALIQQGVALVQKPLTPETLGSKVREVLDGK